MSGFNPVRAKVQLKLSIERLKMLQQKKASLNKHQRREIAGLLEAGKGESARIRASVLCEWHIYKSSSHELLALFPFLMGRWSTLFVRIFTWKRWRGWSSSVNCYWRDLDCWSRSSVFHYSG